HSSSHNLVLNNAIYNVSEGISLVYSGNNKVINNTIRNVTSYGIESAYSPSQRNIINRNTIYNGTGIVIYSCSNNIISNNTIRDIRRGYFPMTPPRGAAGIWIGGGTNNYFFNNTITGSNETCDVYGVLLKYASNNIFSFTEIRNLRSTSNVYAFYSDENSKNNSIYNMTLASYPTTISFIYGNGIALKGVLEEETQSNGELLHIGKFINVTGVTVSSWINVTIHYTEQEIWMVNESSMKLYRYNETSGEWENVTFILNETHNYIKANLTKFSIYGIWGEIGVEEVNISLNKGWNLITIPVILNWKAEDLAVYINTIAHAIYGFDICDTIVMLDAFSQKHIGHPVGAGIPPGSINNFDIVHGVGYWIFVNQSITFNITGTIIKNITIDLQPGFNLLGWTHDNSTNASEVADEIENITMVVEWNNSLDDFITYLKELGAIDFVIARGDGFYVFLAGESEKWYGM
ncbi:MAG TPA: hypothetical protein ENI33_03130, partial [Thermoplasmatales archaeon]|nr:hypothetical protein [Thermoplasmatales archaeon]